MKKRQERERKENEEERKERKKEMWPRDNLLRHIIISFRLLRLFAKDASSQIQPRLYQDYF